MKRLLLLPIVLLLGCEGVGSAYNAMPVALKALIMVLVALAFAVTARFAIPRKVYFSQTE